MFKRIFLTFILFFTNLFKKRNVKSEVVTVDVNVTKAPDFSAYIVDITDYPAFYNHFCTFHAGKPYTTSSDIKTFLSSHTCGFLRDRGMIDDRVMVNLYSAVYKEETARILGDIKDRN